MTKQSKWTDEQEEYLRILKEEKLVTDWRDISKQLLTKFPEMKRRAKQCRERYMNYTRYRGTSTSSLDWTLEQESFIFEKYLQLGPSWKMFCEKLFKRSENCIKNKFYSGIRKFIRKFNSTSSKSYKLKFETIKRMLSATSPLINKNYVCKQKFKKLRVRILEVSQLSHLTVTVLDIEQIKKLFIQFNKEMRCLCLKKKKIGPSTLSIKHSNSPQEKEEQIMVQNVRQNDQAKEMAQYKNQKLDRAVPEKCVKKEENILVPQVIQAPKVVEYNVPPNLLQQNYYSPPHNTFQPVYPSQMGNQFPRSLIYYMPMGYYPQYFNYWQP